MKKMICLVCALALICGIAAGCGRSPMGESPDVSPSVGTPEQTPPPSTEPEKTEPPIRPGVWMAQAQDGQSGQYYFFDADGMSGRTQSFVTGTGLGFAYEPGDDQFIFTWGSNESPLPCKVVVTDETHITLEWETQGTEVLTFVSPLDSWHFHFYTDEELCQLALKDYEARYVPEEKLSAAATDNGDGTVTIQLYQNLGDHNSTAAWYSIDRVTGEGKDISSGDPIDLTNGSPDLDIQLLSEASAIPEGVHECIVDENEYSSQILLTPEVPVTKLQVVLLEHVEEEGAGASFRVIKELFAADSLTPEKPLVIRMMLPETIPNVGITYVDRNGEARQYAISERGLDGAPLLTPAW